MAMLDLKKTAERYERELTEVVAPFWAEHAADPVHGGFYTNLCRDGAVFDPGKNVWMMWRDIYMFAKMCNVGFGRPEYARLAEQGFDFCVRHARGGDGRYHLYVAADGGEGGAGFPMFRAMADVYAAIACAELYRLNPKEEYRREGFSALRVYEESMRGGGSGKRFMPAGAKELGAYMHIVYAAAELLSACGDEDGYCSGLIREALAEIPRFRHPQLRRWLGMRGADGEFDLATSMGRMIATGHGFEVMWFAGYAAEIVGDAEFLKRIPAWTREVCGYAFDRKYGGLFSMQDALDLPCCMPGAGTKQWWTHTEALLGLAYSYKLTLDPWFLERFAEVDEWTWRNFRDPDFPEWFGSVAPGGEVLCDAKGTPAKAFFHLPRCLWFCAKWLREAAEMAEREKSEKKSGPAC